MLFRSESSQLKQALDSVRGAAVRKIIVVYDQPFWGDLPREGIFDPPCGMEIMENSDLEAKRYSLVVFLGGPAADKGMSKENMLLRLSSLLGSGALQPIGFHEQVWLGDEHLCGGYAANRAPGSKFSMAIPSRLGDRIFIAGSDASREFPSYVEGALYGAEKAVAGIVKMQLRIDESMG